MSETLAYFGLTEADVKAWAVVVFVAFAALHFVAAEIRSIFRSKS